MSSRFPNKQTQPMPERYLLNDGSQLTALQVVRALPARRIVCRAEWRGQPVYVKLFIGNKAARDLACDVAGVHALQNAGIATPELLYSGPADAQGSSASALVFAEVAHSRNAEHVLLDAVADPVARLALMTRLAQVVAQHHRAGLVQSDMHLKNFLVTVEAVHTLDGDGIRRYPPPLTGKRAIHNLALMLSKFDSTDDQFLPQAAEAYQAAAGGETVELPELSVLAGLVMRYRLRAARRYADKKVFRSCSDVEVMQNWQVFIAADRSRCPSAWMQELSAPGRLFDTCVSHILKAGNTCTVGLCDVDGIRLVAKRYNIKSFWHGLSRAWRPSRAARSWSNAHRLGMLGLETARPVALVESRWGPLRREAYFFSERVPGRDAFALFGDADVPLETRRQAATAIATMLHKLWRLGLVHGDLKAGNILVTDDGRPVILDLDALFEARCRWQLRRGHARDLRRWMKNWQDAPQTAGMMQTALRAVYQNDDILRAAGIV